MKATFGQFLDSWATFEQLLEFLNNFLRKFEQRFRHFGAICGQPYH